MKSGTWKRGYEAALKGQPSNHKVKRREQRNEPEPLDSTQLKRRVQRLARGR